MSTLDPGLEPPGEWPPPYPTPPTGRTQASERAAGYIWLCAGLSLAMSCCCGISVGAIFALPTSELMSQIPADMPNRGQIQQLLPVIGMVMGVVGVLLLVIPGTALAFLGFPVRSGGRVAAVSAMVLIGCQAAAMGLLVLINLLGVLISRSLSDLISVLLLAGAVALFVKALIAVWSSLKTSPTVGSHPSDPWGM